MSVYQFQSGLNSLLKNSDQADAQEIGEELEKVRVEHGGAYTPDELIASQSSPKKPLHKHFEWDDTVAAVEHRRDQARRISRSVRVVVEMPSGEEKSVHAFASVRSDRPDARRVYVSTLDAIADEDQRGQLISKAINGLKSFRQKFADINEISSAMGLVDEAIEEMEAIH